MPIASPEYNLQVLYPDVAKQWHPTKNGDKKPEEITPGSAAKVWWLCDKGHEWDARITDRARLGTGCPYCSGKKASETNNLLSNYPDVAKQWHPTRNEEKKPEDFRPASNKKVWWLCDRNHEWPAKIAHRTNGRGCPYCSRKRSTE